jgi:putative ABC transport system permease protein
MFRSLRTDLRNAVRSLARAPGMTLSAIACLALGIGGTTAVTSAVSRALLQPLPFRDPAHLVAVHRTTPQTGPQGTWPESPANYHQLAQRTKTVQTLSAITFGSALVDVGGETVEATQMLVTGGLFRMLGATPERGRWVSPDDDRLDAPLTTVLSDAFWRSHFGADPSVVGRTINVDGKPATVVGIAPPDFRVPHGTRILKGDIWTPIRFTPDQLAQSGNNMLFMLGRLAPGATAKSAQGELRSLFAQLVAANPQLRSENVRVAALGGENAQAVRKPLLLLLGAVAMVLLIAATNVAALLLARGVERRREMAVRVALGAGRWHAMRPAIVESLLITAVGAAVGFGLAWIGVRSIGALAASRLPQLAGLRIDARVVAFGIALAIVVGLACGIVPAWRGSSVDPQDALRGGRGGGGGREHHRALRTLVTGEIALSLVLLIGAGLVLKAFASLIGNDPGFETAHVLTLDLTVASARYPNATSVRRFLEPAFDRIAAIPGVESVGSISAMPYNVWGINTNTWYEGQPATEPTRMPLVELRFATPGFFRVTGQRLLAGRLLGAQDDDSPKAPPVVVVNDALVQRDFKGQNPIGRRFHITDTSYATIVGVVSDIRNVGPFAPPAPEMYWNDLQAAPGASQFPVMVRTRGEPSDVANAIRVAVHAVDPTAAVADVAPMPELISHSLGQPRFYVSMLMSFAGVALVLTIAGLYGILSYAVAQRTRELGIRLALGSPRARLVRLVTGEGLALVIVGIAIGLAGSFGLTRLMTSMLYGVSPLDARTWLLAALSLLLPTVIATLIPALRASKADPVVAMRIE